MRTSLLLPCLAVLAAALAIGCGGDGGESPSTTGTTDGAIRRVNLTFADANATNAATATITQVSSVSSVGVGDGRAAIGLVQMNVAGRAMRTLSVDLPGSLLVGEAYTVSTAPNGVRAGYSESVDQAGASSRVWRANSGTVLVTARDAGGVSITLDGFAFSADPGVEGDAAGTFGLGGTLTFALP